MKQAKPTKYPVIPEKRYFTIGEVGDLCLVKPHVLRYWEQEFSVLRPSKRKGSRRYYQRKDILLVRKIRELLYDQEFTISGARQQLKSMSVTEEALERELQVTQQTLLPLELDQISTAALPASIKNILPELKQELASLLVELKD